MLQETLFEDSSAYHYQQFLVKDLAVSFAKMQQQPVKKREKELIYRDVLKEFDFYSLLTKLRYSCVVLNDQKNKIYNSKKINIFLSLSDEKNYSIAFVIIEKNES